MLDWQDMTKPKESRPGYGDACRTLRRSTGSFELQTVALRTSRPWNWAGGSCSQGVGTGNAYLAVLCVGMGRVEQSGLGKMGAIKQVGRVVVGFTDLTAQSRNLGLGLDAGVGVDGGQGYEQRRFPEENEAMRPASGRQ